MDLEIIEDGTVRTLYTDKIDLSKLGPMRVERASFVEFNNRSSLWEVTSAKTNQVLFSAHTREAALEWEVEYYGPGGPGWKELTNG